MILPQKGCRMLLYGVPPEVQRPLTASSKGAGHVRDRTEAGGDEGLLSILFISLIIRSLLLQRAREAGLLNRHSVEDILLEMGKLRAVRRGGRP